jgi:uncharacterized protein YjeT (DUF2065 family)
VLVLAVVGVVLLVAPRPAAAQRLTKQAIDRPSFYLGLAGMGNFVINQANAPVDGFIEQGGGFGLFLGGRLAPMFALEFGYALNFHNPVQTGAGFDALLLHAWTLDGKLIFPNHSNVRPYFQFGFGVYELANVVDTPYRNGIGFQLGGGLDFWLNRALSIGFRALYHGVYFTQSIGETNPFLSTVSVEGNLQFHF